MGAEAQGRDLKFAIRPAPTARLVEQDAHWSAKMQRLRDLVAGCQLNGVLILGYRCPPWTPISVPWPPAGG